MTDDSYSVAQSADKQRADTSAFIFAALLGAGGFIAGGKLVGAPQGLITILVLLTIIFYSLACGRNPSIKLRVDQIGDNAYYLGLLFTMVSMMASLIAIGGGFQEIIDGSLGEQVIGDFGIALASTIVGLLIRTICQQMRTDPGDVEEATREELAAAASELSSDMKRAQSAFSMAADEVAQAAEGTMQRMTDRCTEMLEETNRRLNERYLETADQVAELVLGATRKIDSIAAPLDATRIALQATAEQVTQTSGAIEKVAKWGEALSERLVLAQDAVMESTNKYSESQSNMMALIDTVKTMTTATIENRVRIASQLAERMSQLEESQKEMAAMGLEMKGLLDDLRVDVATTGKSAEAAVTGASETLASLQKVATQMQLALEPK